MKNIILHTTKILLTFSALALSGCMTTDAMLGDFDHAPNHASDRYPIKVVNGPQGARAQVAPCGNWNDDLSNTKDNRSYENLGCAVQSNIAAEIDDPNTLINPRASSVKNSNSAVAAVDRQAAAVSTVTLPSNYAYKP